MIQYVAYFDIAAFVVEMVITLHYLGCRRINTRQTRQLNFFIVVAILSTITDYISAYTIPNPSLVPEWLNYLINEIYIFTFNLCAMLYYGYILLISKDHDTGFSLKEKLVCRIPAIVCAVLIFTTPFTRFIIYFDETGYHHGSLFPLLYVLAYTFMAMSFVHAYRYRKVLTKFQRFIVYSYIICCFLCVVVQMIFPQYLISEFSCSMAILLTYISLDNPLHFVDQKTDCLNELAFVETVSRRIGLKKNFHVLCISIEGMKYISEVLGTSGSAKIVRDVVEIILKFTNKKNVFVDNNRIVVLCQKKEVVGEIGSAVQKRFETTFSTSEMNIMLSCSMSTFSVPENASKSSEILDMVKFSLDKAVGLNSGKIIEADASLIDGMKRESMLAQILKMSLSNNGFDVYYQPILNVRTGRFESAEALIRLKSSDGKFISPEEFIPVAEKNGLIISIGEYVIREVCKFIRENCVEELGIKCIDVNLSPLQCLQENLCDQFQHIFREYGVNPSMINLEITETATINSSTVLKTNMDTFIGKGIDFSLDDFGSGYANISMIVDYPFANIKLDKGMVWHAFENERSMQIIKSIISMVHDINLKVIAEGIETEEHAETLKNMGCDYFQGYYYAKPMPKEKTLEFLRCKL